MQAHLLYDYCFIQNTGIHHYLDSNYVSKNTMNIPTGWTLAKVSDVYDVCYGFPFNSELFTNEPIGTPLARIRNIPSGVPDTYTNETVDSRYSLKNSDLIIGMDGNFHMNLWFIDGAVLNQRCIRIRKKAIPVLIAYFSTMPFIKARENNVSRTTVGHLSSGDIDDLIILLPPEHISNTIMPFFDLIAQNICKNKFEIEKLSQYRDWLLPMLMNGQATIDD